VAAGCVRAVSCRDYESDLQVEVKAFLAYQAWLAHPNRHKEFGQRLHRILVQRGLVTVPAELYLAAEDERQKQATAAIIAAAEEHHAAFNEALHQLEQAGEASAAASVEAAPKATPETRTEAAPAPVAKPAAAKPKPEIAVRTQTTPA
jgi:hypothetical protein